MASARRNIYLPAGAMEYLENADSLSGRVASIVMRYERITRESIPELGRYEWLAICDANNGSLDVMQGENHENVGLFLWANVADSPELGAKWEIDQDALVKKMQKWSYAQQCAAAEVVRTFWKHTDLGDEDALRKAGALK